MRPVPVILLVLTCIWVVTGAASEIALEELRWKHRILLVFPGAEAAPTNSEYVIDPTQRRKLIARYAGDAPVVVLIGKDGGVKEVDSDLDLARTFARIDAMPMRRREMAERATADRG